eukprot:TRINITY_DN6712_c0_g1_i1.p2 TRINITY_DN6712_c0_g1~~TRINITY_DN6712_c0_g1_i1.p2  ORF type:complete len:472 (+),score=122.13 TRINITY_DN6712_c0_g1_i1:218-1633(+)
MSGPDLTTAILSDQQRSLVTDFKALTGLESDSQCIGILEANDWDLQKAVRIALGEHEVKQHYEHPTKKSEDAARHRRVASRQDDDDIHEDQNGPSPDTQMRQSLLANQPVSASSQQSRSFLVPPPVVQSRSCCSKFCFSLLRVLGFGPSVSEEQNLNASQRFIRQFDSTYGASHPQFFDGSFSQALNSAVRSSMMVFVYLHSEDHDDTDAFCRTCLSRSDIVQFLDGHCVSYGVSVKDYEGFRLARWLKVETYPFACLVTKVGGQMVVRGRQDGLVGADQFYQCLLEAHQEFEELSASHRSNDGGGSVAEIVQEQNREYEEALARDKAREEEEEKKRMKLLEEQKQREYEEEQRQLVLKKVQEEIAAKNTARLNKLNSLGEQPDSGAGVFTIQFRLPDGKSIRRRFLVSDTIQTLAAFVEGHELLDVDGNEIHNWEFMMNYPRKTYARDALSTLTDAGIPDQTVLYVREVI